MSRSTQIIIKLLVLILQLLMDINNTSTSISGSRKFDLEQETIIEAQAYARNLV